MSTSQQEQRYTLILTTSFHSQPSSGIAGPTHIEFFSSLDEAIRKWKELYDNRDTNGLKLINLNLHNINMPLFHEHYVNHNQFRRLDDFTLCDYRDCSEV